MKNLITTSKVVLLGLLLTVLLFDKETSEKDKLPIVLPSIHDTVFVEKVIYNTDTVIQQKVQTKYVSKQEWSFDSINVVYLDKPVYITDTIRYSIPEDYAAEIKEDSLSILHDTITGLNYTTNYTILYKGEIVNFSSEVIVEPVKEYYKCGIFDFLKPKTKRCARRID